MQDVFMLVHYCARTAYSALMHGRYRRAQRNAGVARRLLADFDTACVTKLSNLLHLIDDVLYAAALARFDVCLHNLCTRT
jgi:hypothetical protein